MCGCTQVAAKSGALPATLKLAAVLPGGGGKAGKKGADPMDAAPGGKRKALKEEVSVGASAGVCVRVKEPECVC